MATKTIKITKGTEYKFKIEDAKDFTDSLMSDVYNDAAGCTLDIMKASEEFLKKNEEKKEKKSDQDFYNNIIAFVGDRGTGKSSAMLSFANALVSDLKDSVFLNDKPELKNKLSGAKIETLSVIDPSLLEKNDSILEIIVSSLFLKFEKSLKDDQNKDNQQNFDNRKNLLTKFQKVQEVLKTIQTRDEKKSELYNGHTIECLGNLSATVNLKQKFIELVEEYLNFMTKDSSDKNKNYMLIKVDDLDLNFKFAYNMIEQIRKYLIIPQVIVLMGVKLEQLEDIVEQNFIMEFKEKLGCEVISYRTLHEDPKDMTNRYLDKLIPEMRRLNMPDLNVLRSDLNISINGTEITGNNFEETILDEIFKRTSLIFIQNEYELHQIIPRNLRELVGFLTMMFFDMQKVDDSNYNANFLRFEEYFIKHWIRNNIGNSQQIYINELINTDMRLWNKHIVSFMTKINNKFTSFKIVDNEYNRIVSGENSNSNISLGDVLFVLQKDLNNNITDSSTSKVVFCLKTIYSLKMTKLLLSEKIKDIPKLVGYSLYHRESYKIIRPSFSTSRSMFVYHANPDFKGDDKTPPPSPTYQQQDRSIISLMSKIQKVGIWPFFITSYNFLNLSDAYRKNSPIIETNYRTRSTQFFMFDVLYFLISLIDSKKTLNRINSNISEVFNSEFINKVDNYSDGNKLLLPFNSIEFLEQVLIELEKGNDFKEEADDYEIFFSDFFKRLFEIVNKYSNWVDIDRFMKHPVVQQIAAMKTIDKEDIPDPKDNSNAISMAVKALAEVQSKVSVDNPNNDKSSLSENAVKQTPYGFANLKRSIEQMQILTSLENQKTFYEKPHYKKACLEILEDYNYYFRNNSQTWKANYEAIKKEINDFAKNKLPKEFIAQFYLKLKNAIKNA